uniref:tRNA:m(4)X modification enzyme TRM13 n=1 Tax=Elaeophora elaphi TaxID=1147741 RepID=A0A0R3RFK1_9BILA
MLVRSGQKFCGEHVIWDELNEERVVCPNDPKHTINRSQLQKHLSSQCNGRLSDEPWLVENFNLTGSPKEVEPWYRPTNDELLKMRKIVERIYDQIANDIEDSFLKNDYVEGCAADLPKINKKHIRQISSIIEHLRVANLLNNNERWCLVDFGTGRAELFYWMAKIAPKCRFLLVEKMGSRNKFDNKIHKELDGAFFERLRCSVEHLDLSKTDLIRNADNTAAVCKHFCGVATDFGIRCLMNGVKSGLNICGFVLAPCCHHRTTYREYVGCRFLESHGICSAKEFASLRHISTWAVCGFPSQENFNGDISVLPRSMQSENLDQQKTILESISLNSAEKELLGQKAKAVLEFGRVVELQKFGYDVSLCRYVERTVTPENLLIVGRKKQNFERVSNLDLLRGSGLNSVSGPETSEEQKKRFEIECEFVQALANPHYLNFLAQRGYFKEPYFINYLKYLLYWKRPEYARALKYPQCLHFLEAVQSSAFREAITCTANAKFIEEQQLLQWQYYTRKRQRLHISAAERELKFVEALEGTCERMLQYKLHKEKSDISRFAKEESSTMKALNELRNKGVKMLYIYEIAVASGLLHMTTSIYVVSRGGFGYRSETHKTEVELGMPYEMWDTPSVEVVTLKQNCETLLERYENDLEQWYHIQDRPLLEEYLCEKRVLKRVERDCMKTSNNLEL